MNARLGSLLLMAALGAGCASTRAARDKPAPAPPGPAVAESAGKPAWSPLADAGLRRAEVPAVLEQALATPYLRPEPPTCANLAAAIAELDAVLGEDLDNLPATQTEDNFALYALGNGIRGLIPYYGWIRRLSGADRQQRHALEAAAAGHARRGYLKGLGEARGCAPPASPKRSAPAP